MDSAFDFTVRTLGPCRFDSPLRLSRTMGDGIASFVPERTRVLYKIHGVDAVDFDSNSWMERAGPRERIFFEPGQARVAVVTCGGLAPGLNTVIRSLFLELHHKYKVKEVWGFRYGYRGMNPRNGLEPILMNAEFVRTIHNEGGSVLGSSRGAEDPAVIADLLQQMKIDILFCIGGDGTLRGAHAVSAEMDRRGNLISVVGIPKTIDNDIPFVYKTFGFDTAVGVVRQAVDGAHVEAVCTPNGVGLVKVMGRDSGFIAAYGTLASMEVNFCLIPEVPFDLRGEGGLLDCLEKRLRDRGHAVIVVAEGAGQHLFEDKTRELDGSGNKLHKDIGLLLKQEIGNYLKEKGLFHNVKYIDPSYMIRSSRANASDAIFCNNLARNAAHAAMAGKTDVVIGLWHGSYVHIPTTCAIQGRKLINPESYLWRDVIAATGQPMFIRSG